MRTRRAFVAACSVLILSLGSLSCKGITTPSNNQSETFSGTLQPRGIASHPFSVSKTGEFSAKLTAWSPNSQALAGLAWVVGNNDNTCSSTVLQQSNFVVLNAQALLSQIVSGKYCIAVFDPGTLTAAQSYTVTISHP